MKANAGHIDRAIRALIGAGLIGAALGGVIGPWGWIGVVLLLSAAVGWCPLYDAFGIDTCHLRK